MNGGTLKQKITFVDHNPVSDGAGGSISTPEIVLETWAQVKPIKSVKTLEALQEGLNSVYQVNIRMRKGFDPKQHFDVIYKGITYVILTIESDEIDLREWILTITKRES
ncbi:MAG: head-tail adaptor protein [Pedobacter sp.]|nr:MAG: head-tail adaptor protein [Pedobacter sp.]